jgi:hypothetical protein
VLDDKAAPLKVPPQYVGESCSSLDQQNPRAKIRFGRLRPEITSAREIDFFGFEVAAILDRNCANR